MVLAAPCCKDCIRIDHVGKTRGQCCYGGIMFFDSFRGTGIDRYDGNDIPAIRVGCRRQHTEPGLDAGDDQGIDAVFLEAFLEIRVPKGRMARLVDHWFACFGEAIRANSGKGVPPGDQTPEEVFDSAVAIVWWMDVPGPQHGPTLAPRLDEKPLTTGPGSGPVGKMRRRLGVCEERLQVHEKQCGASQVREWTTPFRAFELAENSAQSARTHAVLRE